MIINPNAVEAMDVGGEDATRLGLGIILGPVTQGSACRATLG